MEQLLMKADDSVIPKKSKRVSADASVDDTRFHWDSNPGLQSQSLVCSTATLWNRTTT